MKVWDILQDKNNEGKIYRNPKSNPICKETWAVRRTMTSDCTFGVDLVGASGRVYNDRISYYYTLAEVCEMDFEEVKEGDI